MKTDRAIDLFAAVAAHHRLKWAPSAASKFGTNALRIKGKIFAALTHKHRLLLKLPPARVAELLATGRAKRMQSGSRVMRGWITLAPDNQREWISLSEEARAFVTTTTKPRKKSP
jgi:hypothetical protein